MERFLGQRVPKSTTHVRILDEQTLVPLTVEVPNEPDRRTWELSPASEAEVARLFAGRSVVVSWGRVPGPRGKNSWARNAANSGVVDIPDEHVRATPPQPAQAAPAPAAPTIDPLAMFGKMQEILAQERANMREDARLAQKRDRDFLVGIVNAMRPADGGAPRPLVAEPSEDEEDEDEEPAWLQGLKGAVQKYGPSVKDAVVAALTKDEPHDAG